MWCLTDWKEKSRVGCGSNKIPAFPCQAFRITQQWRLMMHFVDQPSAGRVLGFRRISQIIGFSTLILGSGKKKLTTHGCFVQKCSISLVMFMVKFTHRGQRKDLEITLGSSVIPPAPSPSPLSLDFPAAGVNVNVQGINSKNPMISPYGWPAFLAVF